MENPLDVAHQTGPIVVTLATIALYYAFQIRVAITKKALAREYRERGEKFDRYFGQDRTMLAVDRVQLNMLEHLPPFLVLLWLNAVFVGPTDATAAGAIYLVARAAYPLIVGRRIGRDIQVAIIASTAPGYLVLIYFLGALVWKMLA